MTKHHILIRNPVILELPKRYQTRRSGKALHHLSSLSLPPSLKSFLSHPLPPHSQTLQRTPPPMELQFQQQQQQQRHQERRRVPNSKPTRFKGGRTKSSSSTKFLGVRQRPSGRWVAEIKDTTTTQKIRMWLGTFETAEEAARAYDEAACLLRGSNTRTNFITHVSTDSPIASRIRSLLHHKKLAKLGSQPHHPTSSSTITAESTGGSDNTAVAPPPPPLDHDIPIADEVCRPCFRSGARELEDLGCSSPLDNNSWLFESGFDRLFDGFELPDASSELSEFDRMKVERQISASLYAINGVQEYFDMVHDPSSSDSLWELPPVISPLSCGTS